MSPVRASNLRAPAGQSDPVVLAEPPCAISIFGEMPKIPADENILDDLNLLHTAMLAIAGMECLFGCQSGEAERSKPLLLCSPFFRVLLPGYCLTCYQDEISPIDLWPCGVAYDIVRNQFMVFARNIFFISTIAHFEQFLCRNFHSLSSLRDEAA